MNDSPNDREPGSVPAHVLVVDDQADIRKLLKLTLETRDQTMVHEAIDGENGWERLQEIRPDLVVLDVMMPNTDGLEVCRRIRRDPVLATHTKVILLSGRCQPHEVELGFQAGCDAYLPKTCGPLKLMDKVDELLGADA